MRAQLSLKAENLKNVGRAFQVSDPYAIVTITGGPKEGTVVGRTETIQNTLSPTWAKVMFVDIDPGLFMPFRVSVYDYNEKRDDMLMAEANFEMSEVFQSPGNSQHELIMYGGARYVFLWNSCLASNTLTSMHCFVEIELPLIKIRAESMPM